MGRLSHRSAIQDGGGEQSGRRKSCYSASIVVVVVVVVVAVAVDDVRVLYYLCPLLSHHSSGQAGAFNLSTAAAKWPSKWGRRLDPPIDSSGAYSA